MSGHDPRAVEGLEMVLAIGVVVFLTTLTGVEAIRRWAEKRAILDIPNERSSHVHPTPRGGGLMIVAGTLAGVLATALFVLDWTRLNLLAFTAAAMMIALVSWLDDLRSLSNAVRITVHFAAGGIVLLSFGQTLAFPLPAAWGWIGGALTMVWIAGLTNAYNFMDGIDGIAATQAVVAGVASSFFGWMNGQATTSAVGAMVAASSFGFLIHNWPRARIFMGDVGSAFLGFTFAVLPLTTSGVSHPVLAVLPLWPFVFDPAFTFLRRLRRRERVFSAHRSHLYQRLVIAGLSHRMVTLLYGSLSLLGCLMAWTFMRGTMTLPQVATAVAALAAILWLMVVGIERHTTGSA